MTRSLFCATSIAALFFSLPACDDESFTVGCANESEASSDGHCDVPPRALVPLEPTQQALSPDRQQQLVDLLGAGGANQIVVEKQPAESEPEEKPEKVEWTLSDRAMASYLAWQRHVTEAIEIANVANQILGNDAEDDDGLKREADRFASPGAAEDSLARFGLTRAEVDQIEELLASVSDVYDAGLFTERDGLLELARKHSGAERRFLEAVQAHQHRILKLQVEPLRERFGDANVELAVKYFDQLPRNRVAIDSEAGRGEIFQAEGDRGEGNIAEQ